jgi:photosystem II stability/assembly factor-like uncharacterized protein
MAPSAVRFLPQFLLTAALLLPSAVPQPQQPGLTETFDDPALPGWEHSPGVQVLDGALHIDPGGFAFHPGGWEDLTLHLRLRRLGEGTVSIEYRATDLSAYVLTIGAEMFAVQQREGSEISDLERAPFSVPAGEWIEVTIQAAGTEHEVAVNGVPVMGASGAGPVSPGGVLLRTGPETAGEFDDLEVIPIGLPAEPEPTQPTPAAPEPTAAPAHQPGAWIRLGGPPGGLGYDIRMRPDNPDIMFVTDAFAGIHRSSDGGQTWEPVNSGIPSFTGGIYPIFSATIDPHNPQAIWIGTQTTGHIYLSENGGESWQARDTGIENHESLSFRGITVDPNDPNIVYAAGEISSHGWAGQVLSRRQDLVQGEVYRSTDRGLTWQRIWQGNNLARYVWVDPRDSDRLYVSTGLFDRDAADSDIPNGVWGGVGILRSSDAGQTWEVLDETHGLGGRYVPSLFMHPDSPDMLLAGVTQPARQAGAYATHDGGDSWALVLAMSGGFGAEAVEISQGNPNVWYVASEGRIWRSDDAGATWEEHTIDDGDRRAGMPIDLQVDPRDPLRIFVNNYGGGNFVSQDGGQTWTDASRGYTGIKVTFRIGVDPSQPTHVFAGAFESTDGGATWVGARMPVIGSVVFVGGDDPETVHTIIGSTDGSVYHRDPGQPEWTQAPILDLFSWAQGRLTEDTQPLRAMEVAPSDPQVIYAGFSIGACLEGVYAKCMAPSPGLYRSDDGGYAWRHLSDAPFGAVSILSLAIDPDDPDRVYAGTAIGLYRTEDGGSTWTALTSLDPITAQVPVEDPSPELLALEAPIVYEVRIDPFDHGTLYVASSPGGVYRTEDSGATWIQASAGMDPNEPVYEILCDPATPGVIYASSALSGVFVTSDGGASWTQMSEGLTVRSVRGLALSGDGAHLYAGTIGGGMFRLDLSGQPPITDATQEPIAPPPTEDAVLSEEPEEPLPAARQSRSTGAGLSWGLGVVVIVVAAVAVLLLRRRGH